MKCVMGASMEHHFCQILTRDDKTVLAEYEVKATDWYYARHMAVSLFREKCRDLSLRLLSQSRSWYVDSCIID